MPRQTGAELRWGIARITLQSSNRGCMFWGDGQALASCEQRSYCCRFGELRHSVEVDTNKLPATLRSILMDICRPTTSLNFGRVQATTIYMNARWHAQQRQQMNKKINYQISRDPEKHRWWCLDFSRLSKRGKAAIDSHWPLKDKVRQTSSCGQAVEFR